MRIGERDDIILVLEDVVERQLEVPLSGWEHVAYPRHHLSLADLRLLIDDVFSTFDPRLIL